MKKSQLRKIIRESIKQLMTEETGYPFHKWKILIANSLGGGGTLGEVCSGLYDENYVYMGATTGGSVSVRSQMSVDFWDMTGQPSQGQIVRVDNAAFGAATDYTCYEYIGVNYENSTPFAWFLPTTTLEGTFNTCEECNEIISTGTPGCMDDTATNYDPNATTDDGSCTYNIYGCTDPNASNYDPNATYDDGSCDISPLIGCECDPSRWSNLASWTSTWVLHVNNIPQWYTAGGSQPCDFICQRKALWEGKCDTVLSLNYQNQLGCKIAEANNQSNIHQCNC